MASNNWHIRLVSLALAIAATCTSPANAFASVGGQQQHKQQSSSSLLRYRPSDDSSSSSSYTDSLWQAALHPTHHELSSPSSFSTSSEAAITLYHGSNVSNNAFPLELRPISIDSPTNDKSHRTSSSSADGLVETAKAFVPVAIEFGVVAAVSGNAQYLFNGWQ